MKKVIILLLVLVVGVAVYMVFFSSNRAEAPISETQSEAKTENAPKNADTLETPNLEKNKAEEIQQSDNLNTLAERFFTNITLTIPETDEVISMSENEAEWSLGYVYIEDNNLAQLPNNAVAAILQVNSGGNAKDLYLAVFEPGEASWQLTDLVMLGDYSSNANVTDLYTDIETIYVTYFTYADSMRSQAEEKTFENNEIYKYLNQQLTKIN